jgi:imidazolonepropionase-like amidohydrolase
MKIRTTMLCFLVAVPLALLHLPPPVQDPEAIAITGVSLYDADMHRMRRAMTIVLRDERILAVGPDHEITIPGGAREIDGRGKTLLPAFVKAAADDEDLARLADLDGAELSQFIAARKNWQLAIGPTLSKLEERHDAPSFGRMLALVRRLRNAGVPIVVKTDGSIRELELYEKAGISRLDILYDATLGPARLAHQDDRRGSIQRGKLADMLLIGGAPDRQISDLRNVALVIKNGRVLEPNG